MILFDTHCHFDSLQDAREQLPRAYEAGLRGINVIGTDFQTTQRSIDVINLINNECEELGLTDFDAKATLGLHPHEAKFMMQQKSKLEKLLTENLELICGIGETGFDFYYEHSQVDDQIPSFIWQIDLAKQYDKALVIHTRDAWDQTFNLLDEQGWPTKTVFHCFTGGPEQANRCVENGAYISISGIATFKNAQDVRDAIEVVPIDKLLCETDSPWLAPVPYRGQSNEPAYLANVVELIIKVRQDRYGESSEMITDALFTNAKKVFR